MTSSFSNATQPKFDRTNLVADCDYSRIKRIDVVICSGSRPGRLRSQKKSNFSSRKLLKGT